MKQDTSMENSDKLKQIVKDKYSAIALQSKEQNETSCCGATSCCTVDYAIFAEDYTKLKGYNKDADLGLGCGLPTEFALIKEGHTVLDLGSGAGNDCFIARDLTGPTGKVIGLDFTETMVTKARENSDKLGINNVEFRLGDIENMPINDNSIDVIVSNCVLNLVPNKERAFSETLRVLKPGGHFSVSDVVLKGNLPESFKDQAEMYAGCVSGAIDGEHYLRIIKETGFKEITVQKQKEIKLPEEIQSEFLTPEEITGYQNGDFGIYSITVYAKKPMEVSCAPGSGCC